MGDLMSNGYADKAPFAELPLASHHNTSTFLPHIGCTVSDLTKEWMDSLNYPS